MNGMRAVGAVAGIVLVLGALMVFGQYLNRSTGGASADVINLADLPSQVVLSKDDYATALQLIDSYKQAYDLPTKNGLIDDLKALLTAVAIRE
ncbi:hypothetical protein A3K24_00270 [candidate division Kazan bacterium RIFCSPHIGHO2_01_FULL_44_14]|uniref:Uncharacterized protein n=1 Tax=candidate division Kazan bacterium RIFCSPLOWO2_01_FULL_45_19 TaxID=1798538 RepID=A0A1F4NPC2_UNCK3|nr:MAG: hypothetical protein A3K51_00270 [candidate division Kazan bacterium RIFCSPLOWO2_01_FULL_45_19]OGB77548.1 MAG: hypothetical protein A3K24_00270 [candidate division Kazan bacterium RIFCSPHIGHO2_01_FULL_44_14]